jgi:biopolymer transport protein ExbB/TolQ
MSPENVSNLLTVLTVFTGIVALVLLLQGIALLALYRRVRDLSTRLETLTSRLTKQVEALAVTADSFLAVLQSTAEKVQVVQESVSAITAVVHHRVLEVDAFLTEATDTARLQIAKFQGVMETTSRRIEETLEILQGTVLTPIVEIQALIRGIRTGIEVLFGRRRLPANRSHQDEEMFI